MENLNSQEVMDLVSFYKQKASDTEFNLLQLQIRFNKSVGVIDELKGIIKMHEETITNLTNMQKSLEDQVTNLLTPKPKTKSSKS
jgi:hypothetical protein